MTQTEILRAIQTLPLAERRALSIQLKQSLLDSVEQGDSAECTEREFELAMLSDGLFAHIPDRTLTDAEFDEYEPLDSQGELLSEQIIRERI